MVALLLPHGVGQVILPLYALVPLLWHIGHGRTCIGGLLWGLNELPPVRGLVSIINVGCDYQNKYCFTTKRCELWIKEICSSIKHKGWQTTACRSNPALRFFSINKVFKSFFKSKSFLIHFHCLWLLSFHMGRAELCWDLVATKPNIFTVRPFMKKS